MITIQGLLLANESYTHDNWIQKDVYVGFSRLYYIIDGEAYYEEGGKQVRLKHHHLYLTPVKTCFTLRENPKDKLLHTYVHVNTLPTVKELIEVEVKDGSLLADAVALWRKYIHSSDESSLITVIQFVLSCIDRQDRTVNPIAKQIKRHIDDIKDFSFDMEQLSHQLGYTREHLTRSFLSAYHLTPHQYFNQRRMNIALEYLLKGERVGEVAEKLGFSSLYAFSRSFKHHFGLSPQKYLRLPKSQYPLLSSK